MAEEVEGEIGEYGDERINPEDIVEVYEFGPEDMGMCK